MLTDFNVNDENFEKLDQTRVPDVILIKKYFGDKTARRRARNWKLKHLNEELTGHNQQAESVYIS